MTIKLLNNNRNFAKWEFWKEELVKLFLAKHNSIFGAGYYNRKKQHFSFYRRFIFNNFFFKKNLRKKNLSKISVYNQPVKTRSKSKNNVRAKARWPVLFRYFADIE